MWIGVAIGLLSMSTVNFDLTGNFQSTLYLALCVMEIVQGLLISLESSFLVTLVL